LIGWYAKGFTDMRALGDRAVYGVDDMYRSLRKASTVSSAIDGRSLINLAIYAVLR
jgi:hypothetical protein